jgi:hypothetical protein
MLQPFRLPGVIILARHPPKGCTLDRNETELAGLTPQCKKQRPNEVEASSADGSAIRGGSYEQPDERDRQVRQPDSDGA